MHLVNGKLVSNEPAEIAIRKFVEEVYHLAGKHGFEFGGIEKTEGNKHDSADDHVSLNMSFAWKAGYKEWYEKKYPKNR